MKSILQSIKPQSCELIAAGKKTIEVRKTRPKLETPFKVYIYETKFTNHCKDCEYCSFESIVMGRMRDVCKFEKDNWKITSLSSRCFQNKYSGGKVIGEYVCDKIEPKYCANGIAAYYENEQGTCLSDEELRMYADGVKPLYFWHISDLKIYDKPKELSEFVKCNMPSFDELSENEILCNYCLMTDYGERKSFGFTAGDYYDCGGEECKEAYENYLDANKYLTRPPQSWCYVEEVTG